MSKRAKPRAAVHIADKSLTQQAPAASADISHIMQRASRTGVVSTGFQGSHTGRFLDLVGFDYHAALNRVIEAREAFRALPARIRARFGNDPGAVLAFLENPANHQAAYEMGLVSTPPSPPPSESTKESPPAG